MANYYDILEINKDANKDEIKRAYKKAALKWHPDKNLDNKVNAEEKFKKVTEAYYTLSDDNLKAEYDKNLNEQNNINYNPSGISVDEIFRNFFGTSNVFNIYEDNSDDEENIFFPHIPFQFFHIKEKSNNTNIDLFCTLEELYNGKLLKVTINRKISEKYDVRYEKDIIDIKLKPGWKEGTKIGFKNLGDIEYNKNPGDLIFTIKEKEHDMFKRIDNDLYMTQTISLNSALKGFSKKIKLINGSIYNYRISHLHHSKHIHKVSDAGMPIRKKEKFNGYGNLWIDFDIIFQ